MSNSETQKVTTRMSHLVTAINDGIAADQLPWFSGALSDRAARCDVLDDASWERIHTKILIAGVRQAIASASTLHQVNPPKYWAQVTAACEQVCTALETGERLPEAEKAAIAAAYAAAYAARGADAADTAAYTAYAASRAAARMGDASRAAVGAAAIAAGEVAHAAWKVFAESLFNLIDAELDGELS